MGFGRFLFCLAGRCICFVVVVFIITRILQDVYIKTADRPQILVRDLQCILATDSNISSIFYA